MTADERAELPRIIGNLKARLFFAVLSMLMAIARCIRG